MVGEVVGPEEEHVADTGEIPQMALFVGQGVDVLDELGPGGGPIRLPERGSVVCVVGSEEEPTTDARLIRGLRRHPCRLRARRSWGRAAGAATNVLGALRARRGPVGSPELRTVACIRRCEEDLALEGGDVERG